MSTLNSVTTKIDSIKNNIVTRCNRLKTILTNKGINTNDKDTLNTLIEKVDGIESSTFKMVTGTAFSSDIEQTSIYYEDYVFNHGLGVVPDRVIVKFKCVFVDSFSKRSQNVVLDSFYHNRAGQTDDTSADRDGGFVSSPGLSYKIDLFLSDLKLNDKQACISFRKVGGTTGTLYVPIVFTAIKY